MSSLVLIEKRSEFCEEQDFLASSSVIGSVIGRKHLVRNKVKSGGQLIVEILVLLRKGNSSRGVKFVSVIFLL